MRLVRTWTANAWNTNSIGALGRAMDKQRADAGQMFVAAGSDDDPEPDFPSDPVTKAWLEEYNAPRPMRALDAFLQADNPRPPKKPKVWPAAEPAPPRAGHAQLDQSLERAWAVWKSIVQSVAGDRCRGAAVGLLEVS